MTAIIGFLLAAVVCLIGAPAVLAGGHWQVRRPQLALALWWGAVLCGCLCAAASIVASVVVGLLASRAGSWSEAIFLTMLPWFSLGAVGAVIALIAVSAEPLGESHRRAAQTVAPIAISREDRGAFTLVRFGSDEPTACAIPGRSPEILISTALEEALTTAQLRAVVAHEYAHLRHRHGWAVRAAEINALCLPRALPAGRRLRKATLLLIELIADDIAAKQAGPANLANALVRIGRITADPTLDLRAERMTLRRWPVASRRRVPEPVRI